MSVRAFRFSRLFMFYLVLLYRNVSRAFVALKFNHPSLFSFLQRDCMVCVRNVEIQPSVHLSFRKGTASCALVAFKINHPYICLFLQRDCVRNVEIQPSVHLSFRRGPHRERDHRLRQHRVRGRPDHPELRLALPGKGDGAEGEGGGRRPGHGVHGAAEPPAVPQPVPGRPDARRQGAGLPAQADSERDEVGHPHGLAAKRRRRRRRGAQEVQSLVPDLPALRLLHRRGRGGV